MGIVSETMTRLIAESRSLIMPDMLGTGFSQRVTEPTAAYTVQGRVAHLAQLLDALGVAQVDVIGSSYGGGLATQFALDYPQRVRRLVLIDAQVYGSGGGFFQALGNLPLGIGRAITWQALGAGPQSLSLMQMGCGEAEGYCPTEADIAARQARAKVRDTTDALRAMSKTPPNGRIPDDIGQLDLPVLVIWGAEDAIIDPVEGERLAQDISRVRLEVIPGVGHSPHVEQPAVVADMILNFLSEQ